MPRAVVDDNKRINLRISLEAKAILVRAAALRSTDLTSFVTQTALREAEAVPGIYHPRFSGRSRHAIVLRRTRDSGSIK